jgi:hypothetical protein
MQPSGIDALKYDDGMFRVENGRTIWLCEEVIRLSGGTIPPGHKVRFLDGNAYNCLRANLRVVPERPESASRCAPRQSTCSTTAISSN